MTELPGAPDPTPLENPRDLPGMKVAAFTGMFVDTTLEDIAAWLDKGEAAESYRSIESIIVHLANDGTHNDGYELIVTYSESEGP